VVHSESLTLAAASRSASGEFHVTRTPRQHHPGLLGVYHVSDWLHRNPDSIAITLATTYDLLELRRIGLFCTLLA
jgi:hypothetical protein